MMPYVLSYVSDFYTCVFMGERVCIDHETGERPRIEKRVLFWWGKLEGEKSRTYETD